MVTCKYCRSQMGESSVCACRFCKDLHEQLWAELIGPRSQYADTRMETLRAKNPDFTLLYDQVLMWTPDSGKGLICSGPPGVGKTRTCWQLMRRLHDIGLDIAAMSSTEFADTIAETFGAGHGPQWIRELVANQVLFIDDLDKMVTTKRVQAELFAVLEAMTASGKMLIVTTNCGGQDFIDKFDPGVGPAIYRRLTEFCRHIGFLRRHQ